MNYLSPVEIDGEVWDIDRTKAVGYAESFSYVFTKSSRRIEIFANNKQQAIRKLKRRCD